LRNQCPASKSRARAQPHGGQCRQVDWVTRAEAAKPRCHCRPQKATLQLLLARSTDAVHSLPFSCGTSLLPTPEVKGRLPRKRGTHSTQPGAILSSPSSQALPPQQNVFERNITLHGLSWGLGRLGRRGDACATGPTIGKPAPGTSSRPHKGKAWRKINTMHKTNKVILKPRASASRTCVVWET
jgi:hypothetical protein